MLRFGISVCIEMKTLSSQWNITTNFQLLLPFKVVLVLDPMLATGGSAVATVDILKRWGVDRIKFVGLLAAPEGVEAMQKAHSEVPIYLAKIDEKLNEIGYIVPGLGDAGDRQFGTA